MKTEKEEFLQECVLAFLQPIMKKNYQDKDWFQYDLYTHLSNFQIGTKENRDLFWLVISAINAAGFDDVFEKINENNRKRS